MASSAVTRPMPYIHILSNSTMTNPHPQHSILCRHPTYAVYTYSIQLNNDQPTPSTWHPLPSPDICRIYIFYPTQQWPTHTLNMASSQADRIWIIAKMYPIARYNILFPRVYNWYNKMMVWYHNIASSAITRPMPYIHILSNSTLTNPHPQHGILCHHPTYAVYTYSIQLNTHQPTPSTWHPLPSPDLCRIYIFYPTQHSPTHTLNMASSAITRHMPYIHILSNSTLTNPHPQHGILCRHPTYAVYTYSIQLNTHQPTPST